MARKNHWVNADRKEQGKKELSLEYRINTRTLDQGEPPEIDEAWEQTFLDEFSMGEHQYRNNVPFHNDDGTVTIIVSKYEEDKGLTDALEYFEIDFQARRVTGMYFTLSGKEKGEGLFTKVTVSQEGIQRIIDLFDPFGTNRNKGKYALLKGNIEKALQKSPDASLDLKGGPE